MTTPKYKTLWFFLRIISLLAFAGISFSFIRLFLPSAFAGNVISILFLGWLLFLMLTTVVSYVISSVLHIGLIFPEQLLLADETILVNSSLLEVIGKSVFFSFSISRQYITITNKRVIFAANIFGFWTYKHLMRSVWFGPTDHNQDQHALEVKMNKTADGLIIVEKYRTLEIIVSDPERILQNI